MNIIPASRNASTHFKTQMAILCVLCILFLQSDGIITIKKILLGKFCSKSNHFAKSSILDTWLVSEYASAHFQGKFILIEWHSFIWWYYWYELQNLINLSSIKANKRSNSYTQKKSYDNTINSTKLWRRMRVYLILSIKDIRINSSLKELIKLRSMSKSIQLKNTFLRKKMTDMMKKTILDFAKSRDFFLEINW